MREAWLILPGVLAAALGGELFVRSTVGAAGRARIAPGIVAATVAAFATSSPELAVGLTSATRGAPEISLGDVLGSNIFNGLLIVGVVALIAPIPIRIGEFAITIVAGVLTMLLVIPGRSNRLPPLRGALLLVTYVAYLGVLVQAHDG